MCCRCAIVLPLHLRSEYPDVPVHVSAQEALKYYTAQSEKYWTSFTLYGKTMISNGGQPEWQK